jgi:hypothetical protein
MIRGLVAAAALEVTGHGCNRAEHIRLFATNRIRHHATEAEPVEKILP